MKEKKDIKSKKNPSTNKFNNIIKDKISKVKSKKKNIIFKSFFNKILESKNTISEKKIIEKISTIEFINKLENTNNLEINLSKIDENYLNKNKNFYDFYYDFQKKYNLKISSNKNFDYVIKNLRKLESTIEKKYLFKILTNNEYDDIEIKNFDKNSNYFEIIKKTNFQNNEQNKNYYIRMNNDLHTKNYKDKDLEKKIETRLKVNLLGLFSLYNLKDFDKININCLFIIDFINNKNLIFIEFLRFFFKDLILFKRKYIFGLSLKKEFNKLDLITKVVNNNFLFDIVKDSTINKNLDKIFDYYKKIIIIENEAKKYLMDTKNESFYVNFKVKILYNIVTALDLNYFKDIEVDFSLFISDYFRLKIYSGNNIKKISSAVNTLEGNYISKVITKNNYKKCLEVGLAHGLSSIYILKNKNTSLISIDPFQKSQWDNDGLKFIKHFNFDKRHKLIEKKSYNALPELLNKHGEKSFDFIFIDGFHTFDYTLIDFFYSDLLLEINGIIIIDDALHQGVRQCCEYLNKNFKHFKKLDSPNSIAVYKKLNDDKREWNFHVRF